jgi:stage II sporulation protein D
VLASGIVGYVREDLVTDTGAKTPSGLTILTPNTSGVNVRPVPSIRSDLPTDTTKIATVNPGDKLIVIEQRKEWNAYSWVTGLMTGKQLQDKINSKGLSYKNAKKQWVTYKLNKPVATLEITKKGKSGRPIEIEANGSLIPVSSPDNYRSVLGLLTSLWSTRFEVDNTGSYTILGANGKQVSYPATNGDLYALNAKTVKPKSIDDAFIAMNNNDTPRYMTITPSFRFIGFGFGHGLGMSQWGAMGLAQYPTYYNYKQILMHYYPTISIEKGTSS